MAAQHSWLRLTEAVAILVKGGLANAAAETSLGRAIASGIMVRPDRNPALPFDGALRFRVHADIRQSAGTTWRAMPNLDFFLSTIVVPSRGDNGFAQFESKLRPSVIEVWAKDVPRCCPVTHGKRGRRPSVDWEKMRIKAQELMDEHGDFTAEDSAWNAQARLKEAFLAYCANDLGVEINNTVVGDFIRKFLPEWRQRKLAGNSAA
jgi:hypothetical protein